jgi:molybdate transport system substrate-binding protein
MPRLQARTATLALFAMMAAASCKWQRPALLVFAAASTSGPLEEIGRAFEHAAGQHVDFAFGATPSLVRQIESGAPADVLLSADTEHMDELERRGLVRHEARVTLLSNELVIVVPASSPNTVSAPSDLTAVKKLALASPDSAPAGIYAKQWLSSMGLWEKLAPDVTPVADVRAALAAVASGAAGAGIVYRTDAATSSRVRVAFSAPREAGPKIVYTVSPLVHARSPVAAAFVSYLQGPEARAAFTRFGFIVL